MSNEPSDLDQIFSRLSEIFLQLETYPADDPSIRRRLESERESLRRRVETFPERGDRNRSVHQLRAELEEYERQIIELQDQTIRQSGFSHGLTSSIRHDSTVRSGVKALNDAILDAGGAGEMRKRMSEIDAELERRGISG